MLSTLLLSLLLLPSGSEWPGFRGADGVGVLFERAFPSDWGAGRNIAWTADVPGSGWSSPVVVAERVFVTTAVRSDETSPKGFVGGVSDPSTRGAASSPSAEVRFHLRCLSLDDGSTLWARDVGTAVPAFGVHASNTYATESPASDGERIFVTYGALGEVVSYDLEGEELWRVESGVFKTGNDFGWGSSLLATDGLVFLQNDNEESSFLLALDASSGEERWRAERPTGTSWGTPIRWPVEGRSQVVTCGPDRVVAYAAADGEELWRVDGIGGSFSSSPTSDSERVYFGNSGPRSRGPLVAVAAHSSGAHELRGEEPGAVAWREEQAGPGFASPVVSGRHLYVLASGGILALHDAQTGERLWRERLPDAATVVASPWIAGDELFVLDEQGTTFVVSVGDEFELRGTNTLDGLFWSTPSIAGDALLLRASDRLHCVREAR
jgi:outer membrane protein assembly factor BamB